MIDREKVIDRLQQMADSFFENRYFDFEAVEDAIAMLKAQEPRLVTEADFENADEYGFIPVWCEVIGNTKDYWNCITIGALETAKEDGCRYWTSKPSLKQMEDTPWN